MGRAVAPSAAASLQPDAVTIEIDAGRAVDPWPTAEGKTPMPPTSHTAPGTTPQGPSKPAITLAWHFDGAHLDAEWISTETQIDDAVDPELVA